MLAGFSGTKTNLIELLKVQNAIELKLAKHVFSIRYIDFYNNICIGSKLKKVLFNSCFFKYLLCS